MPIFDHMKSFFSLPSAEEKNKDNILLKRKKAIHNDKSIASNFTEKNYQSKQQDINFFSKTTSQEKKETNTINSLTYKAHEIISMSSPFAYQQRTLISAENFFKEKDYNTAKEIYTKLINKIPIKNIRDKLQINLQNIENIQKEKVQTIPHSKDKELDHKNNTINSSQDDYSNVEIKTLDQSNFKPNQFKDQKNLSPSLAEGILQHINQSVTEIKKMTQKIKGIEDFQKKVFSKNQSEDNYDNFKTQSSEHPNIDPNQFKDQKNLSPSLAEEILQHMNQSVTEIKKMTHKIKGIEDFQKKVFSKNQSEDDYDNLKTQSSEHPNIDPNQFKDQKKLPPSPAEKNLQHITQSVMEIQEAIRKTKKIKSSQKEPSFKNIGQLKDQPFQSIDESTLNTSTPPQKNNINNKIQTDSEVIFSNKKFKGDQEISESTTIDRDREKENQNLEHKLKKIPPIKNRNTSRTKIKENITQNYSTSETTKKSSQESKLEKELSDKNNEKKPLPQEVHGVFNIKPPDLEDSPSLMLTYDFTKIPYHFRLSKDNQFFEYTYYKYKPMLSKAHKFIKKKQIGKALSYYKVINDQEISDELRNMISKNIQDINDFMKKYLS